MDPNEALRRIRELSAKGDALTIGDLQTILEYVDALDEWLSRGGFLPDAWRVNR